LLCHLKTWGKTTKKSSQFENQASTGFGGTVIVYELFATI